MARLKSEAEIRVVIYPPPRFLYQVPFQPFGGTGAFNPVTGGFVGGGGDPRNQVYAIDTPLADPVREVRDVFLKGLAGHFDAARLIQSAEPLTDDDVRALAKKFGGGVVLDFQTTLWGLLSGYSVAKPYGLAYLARARVLRLETGRVLWQGQCEYGGRDPRGNWDNFDTSLAVVEKKFAAAANVCAQTLLAQFLSTSRQ
ncbi:MAG: hypothetical protein ACREQP_03235 [Candidatus Binatia bacterium]